MLEKIELFSLHPITFVKWADLKHPAVILFMMEQQLETDKEPCISILKNHSGSSSTNRKPIIKIGGNMLFFIPKVPDREILIQKLSFKLYCL